MKVEKKKLSGEAIRAFMDTIGFGKDDFDEDLDDTDLDEEFGIPSYEEIYNEELLSRKVENMMEDLRNEPLEESEEERINREADEIIESRFNRAYDYYCGLMETRYETLDECNIPLDEDALISTSCKYNCDIEPFVEKLKERMAKNRGE